MNFDVRICLLFGASALTGCHLAIGEHPPVDYSVFEGCKSYISGSLRDFPLGGPSIGSVAPGAIPNESRLRFGVELSAGSTVQFTSSEFELFSKDSVIPQKERGELFTNPGQRADEGTAKIYSEDGEIRNETDSERIYLIQVFSVSTLPNEFIVRVPDVKVWGTDFRGPDFAFKYFPDRNAIGLCN